jgi:cytochrome P450
MTLLHLMTTPHAYLKLQHECRDTNIPLDSIISHSRALSLPYLQAVIREGLRIYPAATGLTPKIAPPEGDTLEDGTYIPAGTQVGIASWLIYHNPAVYGSDAEIFRPERWIESGEAQVAEMKRSLELLFGYGRFKCLGQNVAMMELPKVIFELVRRFDWSLEDPFRPLERNRCYGLFMQKGMWVRVCEREGGGGGNAGLKQAWVIS